MSRAREEFEAWISSPPYEREVERFGDGSAWPGSYREIDVDLAWCSWSASRSALAAPAERVAQWRPIETAPTGRIHSPPLHAIVASVLDSGEFYVEEAWWDNERLEWWPANVDYGDAHGSAVHPTHWMPLPDAPGGITGGTEGGAQADGAQGSAS